MPGSALPGAGGSEAFLDTSALSRLRQLGGDAFLTEMIDLFLEHFSTRLESAIAGERRGDLDAVAFACHTLRSSAGNLGATVLQDLSSEIERHARDRNVTEVRARMADLTRAFENARRILEKTRQCPSEIN